MRRKSHLKVFGSCFKGDECFQQHQTFQVTSRAWRTATDVIKHLLTFVITDYLIILRWSEITEALKYHFPVWEIQNSISLASNTTDAILCRSKRWDQPWAPVLKPACRSPNLLRKTNSKFKRNIVGEPQAGNCQTVVPTAAINTVVPNLCWYRLFISLQSFQVTVSESPRRHRLTVKLVLKSAWFSFCSIHITTVENNYVIVKPNNQMIMEAEERESSQTNVFQVAHRDLLSSNLPFFFFFFPRVVFCFHPCWYPDLAPAAQPGYRNNAALSRRHARICR